MWPAAGCCCDSSVERPWSHGGWRGWLIEPAQGISPAKSVSGVIRNIENLTQDAEILLYDGSVVPW